MLKSIVHIYLESFDMNHVSLDIKHSLFNTDLRHSINTLYDIYSISIRELWVIRHDLSESLDQSCNTWLTRPKCVFGFEDGVITMQGVSLNVID